MTVLKVSEGDDAETYAVTGAFDWGVVLTLRALLAPVLLDGRRTVRLDLRPCTSIDSVAIGLLVGLRRRLGPQDRILELLCVRGSATHDVLASFGELEVSAVPAATAV